jgi:hypothetical protein
MTSEIWALLTLGAVELVIMVLLWHVVKREFIRRNGWW